MASKAPNIGSLDRKITIETYTYSPNEYGERVKTWSTFLNPWAKVDFGGGNKEEEDGKITSTDEIKFCIRHNSTLTAKMRVIFEGQTYTIRSIENIGRRRFTEIKSDTRIGLVADTSPSGAITADMDTITVDQTDISADQTIY